MTSSPRTECFIYQLVPGCGPTYDEYHRAVWPEVRTSLRASGIVEYAIYRRGDLVISVLTRDPSLAVESVDPEVRRRVEEWAAVMAPLFVASADEDGLPLFADHIFQL